MKHQQRGVSFIGILFVGGILVFGGILVAQVFPTMLEFQAVRKAAAAATAGNTVGEVRSRFDKAAQIDDIHAITGKDLEVTKEGDKTVVAFSYSREIHLGGPAFLVLKYKGKTN